MRHPVITLVLYFGLKHWDKPTSLLDAIRLHTDIPEELVPYLNDFKINLFEIAWLTPDQVSLFKSDFKYVADYFVQMRMHNDYKPSAEIIRHVHEVLQLMTVLTEDYRFEKAVNRTAKTPLCYALACSTVYAFGVHALWVNRHLYGLEVGDLLLSVKY